jgi:hypothetical protein
MNNDYSFEYMEQRARLAKGRSLTNEEIATIKKMADEIADLEQKLAASREADEIAAENSEVSRTYKAMLNEIESEKLPIAPKELDSFWVGLISLFVILFLLIFGGYGLIKLLL